MSITDFIREQPAAFDRSVAAARAFAKTWSPGTSDGFVLVGSGSSFNALQAARAHFVAARRGMVLVEGPEDFRADLPSLTAKPLVIVLSQSGMSVTSIAAAKAAVEAGLPTLALTASPGAPLAASGARLLVFPVGEEPVGPKTKGFVGSLATLLVLAEAFGAPTAETPSGKSLARTIEAGRERAAALVQSLADVDQIIIAGQRAHYGIALEATLKIAEMSGIPAAAFSTEELLHGRLHGTTGRSVIFLLTEGDGEVVEGQRIASVMAARGCRAITLTPAQVAGEDKRWEAPWSAVAFTVVFQWLAVLLAEARGLRPETMRHGNLSAELAIKADDAP